MVLSFYPSKGWRAHFAHQAEQITLRIAAERHPQIVIVHVGDQVGLVFKLDLLNNSISHLDIPSPYYSLSLSEVGQEKAGLNGKDKIATGEVPSHFWRFSGILESWLYQVEGDRGMSSCRSMSLK
jgi:hypothetical protein